MYLNLRLLHHIFLADFPRICENSKIIFFSHVFFLFIFNRFEFFLFSIHFTNVYLTFKFQKPFFFSLVNFLIFIMRKSEFF